MASQEVSYSIDDKDLDDATLWALMDSASTSSLSSKPHKSHQPPTPVSHHSSPVLSFATRPAHRAAQHSPREDSRLLRDGEVVQEPRAKAYEPLPKIARMTYSPGVGETSPLQLVMRSAQRSPATAVKFSPEISLLGISSPGNNVQSEEREAMRHGLSGRFPTVSLFKEYQNAAMAILEKTDYTMISGHPFIKKSGWRKISCYFNLSYEIRDKTIEFDENRDVQRAEFIVRACMQGGRFSDGWGSCDRREKRFSKPNHDIPSTAETRAKNKACQSCASHMNAIGWEKKSLFPRS